MTIKMPTDRYIQVEGVNTRYWVLGEQGSPVLFIHGQGGAIDYWYKMCLRSRNNIRFTR